MRIRGGMIGAALLAAACGSSRPSATTGGPSLARAGAACASDAACASGICGTTRDGGSGNCCAKACGDDVLCGATACDSAGTCVYPPRGTSCGSSCADAILSPRSCDGSGVCQPADGGNPCPENLGCADFERCNQSCSTPVDCAAGFTCKNGACFAQIATGPCSENLDCVSGVCGPQGTGNCCAAPCTSTFQECGATECDRLSGACLYADAGMTCGSVFCAPGIQTNPTLCDGLGHCRPVSCAPYSCGLDACLTSCATGDLSCSPGAFCEADLAVCCAGLGDGGNIHVDWLAGSDATPCCGFGGAPPCGTLTYAMSLIQAAGAHDVTLTATVGSDGGDWPVDIEPYPLTLGGGLELIAPGVHFQTLEISTAPGDGGSASASIVGTAANPVVIGASASGDTSNTADSIVVEPGNTLYLANARVYGDYSNFRAALTVLGGASLVLGQDQSAGVSGTVYVGDPAIPGYNGIQCLGGSGPGCTISDAPLQDMSSVVFQNQSGDLLYASNTSDLPALISLTSAPIFGEPPSSTGFEKCLAKSGYGVELDGNVTMILENGTVQCLDGFGLGLADVAGGAGPELTVDKTTIQNTDTGIFLSGGNVTISGSIIRYNHVGVWQDSDGSDPTGTIDLSGGAGGGGNSVVCTSSSEANPYVELPFPAMAVLNMTSATLNASNVRWDTAGPDQFLCDPSGTMCTCAIPSCTNPGGVDGMDAVNMSTGTITTTGHTLSSADCTAPPLCGDTHPCPSGQFCCADFGYCLPFPCPG